MQVVAPVIAKPLKVNLREPFDGSRRKLWAFFSQVELFFRFNINKFTNEEYKVLFAGLYLQGPAFKWFNTFLQDFLNNDPKDKDNASNVIIQNFFCFKKQMQTVFEDFHKKHIAERKIQVLQQTGSAAEYAFKFQ